MLGFKVPDKQEQGVYIYSGNNALIFWPGLLHHCLGKQNVGITLLGGHHTDAEFSSNTQSA